MDNVPKDEINRFFEVEIRDVILDSYEVARKSLFPHLEKSRKLGRSQYWTREVASLEYLWDAPPLLLMRLREHCHWITGVHPYQYSSHHQDKPEKTNLSNRLSKLKERSPKLSVVSERPEYAGFGFEIEGSLYNVDTLKYHEVLIGITEVFQYNSNNKRLCIAEIGSGFGGLADVLMRSFENSKMVLVDLPEVLLMAHTFMASWFPDKVIRIPLSREELLEIDERDFDILCVPNYLITSETLVNFNIDLLLNTVSFQEMTSTEVNQYIDFGARNEIKHLYSLNRDVSHYNPELDSVRKRIETKYDVREISILESEYTSALKGEKKKTLKPIQNPYRHVAGFLRTEINKGR